MGELACSPSFGGLLQMNKKTLILKDISLRADDGNLLFLAVIYLWKYKKLKIHVSRYNICYKKIIVFVMGKG